MMIVIIIYRRKFRSQTSDNDNVDRWKAEMGRVTEEKKKEDQRRDNQKKEDPGARKGGKVVKHCLSNDLWLRKVEK